METMRMGMGWTVFDFEKLAQAKQQPKKSSNNVHYKIRTLKQTQQVSCRFGMMYICFVCIVSFCQYVCLSASILFLLWYHIYYNVEKHSSTKYLCEQSMYRKVGCEYFGCMNGKSVHSDSAHNKA